MNNSSYWKLRFKELEKLQNKKGNLAFERIEGHFLEVERKIEKEIVLWYQRFAKNNNISMIEAKLMLNRAELKELKWDINKYIEYGKQNTVNGKWLKELENASARFHITRLESLKLKLQQEMEVMFGNQLDTVDKMTRDILTNGYSRTIFEIQKGFNIGFDIGQIDDRKVDLLVKQPWAVDGYNFSKRIWKNKKKLIEAINMEMTQAIIRGEDPRICINKISKIMGNSRQQVGRLIMTEQAYFHSMSQKEAYQSLGVEQVEIVATLDSHTSELCQSLDGKVLNVSDYKSGITAPPFHPWCRTTTCPYFNDEWSIGERAASGKDGTVHYIPAQMKYPEWKQVFLKSDLNQNLKDEIGDDIIEPIGIINALSRLKASGISESDYDEFLDIINNHKNPSIVNIYRHADEISVVKFEPALEGAYAPSSDSIKFNFNAFKYYPELNKFGTLAHEYGHFFDAKINYKTISFKEIEAVSTATGLDSTFRRVASSSDEFLAAVRKDKIHLKRNVTPEVIRGFFKNNNSNCVQDAIDGLFPKSKMVWGHDEQYYNRKFEKIVRLDKLDSSFNRKKALKEAYKDLGFDASNQVKVKNICRQYETASEIWANVMSAEVCGGESLDFIQKYLPNSYQAMLDILKGVE